jgi:hypothetical protein
VYSVLKRVGSLQLGFSFILVTSINSGLKQGSTIRVDFEGRVLKNFRDELTEV